MEKRKTVSFNVVLVEPSEKRKDKLDFCYKCCFSAEAGYICCAPRALYDDNCGVTFYYQDID